MGNEISKKYEMSEEPSASGGLSCLWKIYSATEKASGVPVSIHVFKKDDLKDLDKARREQVLDILRREMKTLGIVSSRSHPSIVRQIESFEENRSLLAFVTERVACSLADAIGEGHSDIPRASSAARRTFERYEIARGFFGLVEALQFVHTIKRRVHLNLAPESIFLSPSGQFKLGGFGFSVDLPSDGSSTTPCPYFQTGAKTGFEGMWRLHPVMGYSSPEATAPAGSSDVSCASDMFSLGCLMYQFSRDDYRGARLVTSDPMPQAHQTFCATLDFPGRLDISPLFGDVQSLVSSLLQTNPAARPQLGTVTINPFFHGKEVTVLKTIDGIPARNPAEAATFLTSIRTAVSGFPLRVQRDCIMHSLLDACASEESERLWGSALPIITDVCRRLDRKEIVANVQSKFRPALKAQPLEALLALVDAMPIFLQNMEMTFFRSDVVPMVCRALQAQGVPGMRDDARRALEVHEAAVKAVTEEAFHRAIDGRTRELEILPRVCWLIVKSTALRVKVNALLCLSKTFHFYQVRAVVDKVLPTLKFAAERDQTVAVQLCVLGCYEAVSKRLEKLGPVATHILPACTPMLACQGLNSNQFEMVVGILQGMVQAIIAYRKEEIANPKSTNIESRQPTHPGGVPDQEQIAKARLAALGGWKPMPAASSASIDSKVQPLAGLPGSSMSTPASVATAASAQGSFNMADFGLSLPYTPTTGSSRQGLLPSSTSPTNTNMSAASPATGIRTVSPSSGAFAGSSSATNFFQDLPTPQSGGVGQSSSDTSVGGLGAATGQGASSGGTNPELSWLDDMFAGGGVTSPHVVNDSMGRPGHSLSGMTSTGKASLQGMEGGTRQASLSPSGTSGLSWAGGMARQTPAPPTSIRPPPPPAASTTAGDPFGAFFDTAISGSKGIANSSAAAVSRTFAGGYGIAKPGGYSAPHMQGGRLGSGAMQSVAAGGSSLEDQLAKTRREIEQLTRELGGAGSGVVSPPGTVGGMGGLGVPGGVGVGGVGNSTSFNSAPMSHSQNTSQDPFACLDLNPQGSQQSNNRGAAPSGFDFLSKH